MPAPNISIAKPTSAKNASPGVAGSSQRKPVSPITHPRRELADDDRYDAGSARREQRPSQSGGDDQREHPEGHRAII